MKIQIAGISKKELLKRVLTIHIVVFVMVNALLASINYMFTPHYLWYLYAMGPWGIGLTAHLLLTFLYREDPQQDKAARAQKVFTLHLVLYLLVNGLLSVVNLLYTPHVLWFIFPAFGWGIGLVLHFIASFFWAAAKHDDDE